MKKEIRVVDKENGILQVTTADERWYIRDKVDPETGEAKPEFVPSVTWICDHYPKGVQFYKWLASKGWDEAEAIKTAAGDKGSRVHKAIQDLIEGREIKIDAKYKSYTEDKEVELTFEEYEAVLSFARWHKEVNPVFLAWEFPVWGDGYAGTVDLLCCIDGQNYLVDFKTSAYIWPSHELQVSAYKHALGLGDAKTEDAKETPTDATKELKLAILQVGYRMNKKRFKFTEIDDQYPEFMAAKLIWAKEQKGVEPRQRDYPMSVKLDLGENNEAPAESQDGVRAYSQV